jgi:hypothetical protein
VTVVGRRDVSAIGIVVPTRLVEMPFAKGGILTDQVNAHSAQLVEPLSQSQYFLCFPNDNI